jgi:Plant transposon protein.
VKLPLLVLGALPVLGSGCTFDALEELMAVSRDTHRKFFHNIFCTWGQYVVSSVLHVMALYERQGLLGCVSSVYCVYVCWDQCLASMHSTCKGTDKYPTLVFEVACSHTRNILHVSQFFWRTYNDQTISRMDPLFRCLHNDDAYLRNLRWSSPIMANGTLKTHHCGAYLICDSGYNEWACLMPPYKHQLLGSGLLK